MTINIDYRSIIADWTDDAVRQAASTYVGMPSSLRAVRDSAGNLRELTDAEEAFGVAIKAEFRARFL